MHVKLKPDGVSLLKHEEAEQWPNTSDAASNFTSEDRTQVNTTRYSQVAIEFVLSPVGADETVS